MDSITNDLVFAKRSYDNALNIVTITSQLADIAKKKARNDTNMMHDIKRLNINSKYKENAERISTESKVAAESAKLTANMAKLVKKNAERTLSIIEAELGLKAL